MFLIIAQFKDWKNPQQTYFKQIRINSEKDVEKRLDTLKAIGKKFCSGCTSCSEPCGDKLLSYQLFSLVKEENLKE